jgi:hypothetical protein
VRLSWWRLESEPAAGDVRLSGKWVPWTEVTGRTRQQPASLEPAGCLVVTLVQLIPSSKTTGALHQRWARLTAASLREGALRLPRALA